MSSGPASSVADPLEGTPYRTLAQLGRGASSRVVSAEHRVLKTRVCIKILYADASSSSTMADRFRIEAQALSALGGGHHPHLVRVRDFDVTPTGRPFLVMEYLEGRTFEAERKARGEVPWREAVGWIVQVLRGVQVAHEAGIVHRDIKPANLFLSAPPREQQGEPTKDLHARVLDFGIAKILDPGGPVAPLNVPTGVGLMIGTPRYCSPEQARTDEVDARADLYSIGLVLFELVTGRQPFEDKQRTEEMLLAQVFDPLGAPSSFATQRIPPALDLAVAKATHKSREARYADARAFMDALEVILVDDARGPVEQTVQKPKRSSGPGAAQPRARLASGPSLAPAPAVVPAANNRAFFVLVTIMSTLLFATMGWWLVSRWLP